MILGTHPRTLASPHSLYRCRHSSASSAPPATRQLRSEPPPAAVASTSKYAGFWTHILDSRARTPSAAAAAAAPPPSILSSPPPPRVAAAEALPPHAKHPATLQTASIQTASAPASPADGRVDPDTDDHDDHPAVASWPVGPAPPASPPPPSSAAAVATPLPTPPDPPGPEDCCMGGCAHCVWDVYQDDFDRYVAELARRGILVDATLSAAAMDPSVKALRDMERAFLNGPGAGAGAGGKAA
ncbi:hypothetical protein DFJ73DRAFT_758839 [Zopfochytrium polystomum]|nr:hypothetical protein DFJ73DRAFT_758839 [Zopfochytrium polystomum]